MLSPTIDAVWHGTTLLADGSLLITGGLQQGAQGKQTRTGRVARYLPGEDRLLAEAPMVRARAGHGTLRLPDGMVLIDGGNRDLVVGKPPGTTAEVFDPAASLGAWREVAWGGLTRIFGALHWVDGRVIGDPACSSSGWYPGLPNVQTYEPGQDAWFTVSKMEDDYRCRHSSILIDGERLWRAGGRGALAPSSTFFNVKTLEVTEGPAMLMPRAYHSTAQLPDGRLLLSGGYTEAGDRYFYDPASDSATLVDLAGGTQEIIELPDAFRDGHTATALADGRVLLLAGDDPTDPSREAWESKSPGSRSGLLSADGTYEPLPPMPFPRRYHTATLLPDGRVIVVGGMTGVPKPDANNSALHFVPQIVAFLPE
ncbi:MAG: hypothetical protein JRH20_31465 [Deltaproteobacteria bacterium]|nr:hypothetical protein [Deltaproteobacteria bacterium]